MSVTCDGGLQREIGLFQTVSETNGQTFVQTRTLVLAAYRRISLHACSYMCKCHSDLIRLLCNACLSNICFASCIIPSAGAYHGAKGGLQPGQAASLCRAAAFMYEFKNIVMFVQVHFGDGGACDPERDVFV